MTIFQLHKRLGQLIAAGHKREQVCVSKDTFRHNCEGDGVTILPLGGIGIRTINIADDDGGIGYTKAGVERTKTVLILAGDAGANSQGDLVESPHL